MISTPTHTVTARTGTEVPLPVAPAPPLARGAHSSRIGWIGPRAYPVPDHLSELDAHFARYRIAVLVPCYNEAATIGSVVTQFCAALPNAIIYVYDNNSTDGTAEVAMAVGAEVRLEARQGKGNVARRMFSDIEADVYVLVDGDATYEASSVREMIARLIRNHLDMVVGTRREAEVTAYPAGHRLGNMLLTACVASLFGRTFTDVLSGYRVFSRRFVKSIPLLSRGFEIETELTIHALELGLPVAEVPTPYYARPKGSKSKLSTWRDGWRILWTVASLQKSQRPLLFFVSVAGFLQFPAILLTIPVLAAYVRDGTLPTMPIAATAVGLTVMAILSVTCGLILSTVTRGRLEAKLLAYLRQTAPGVDDAWKVPIAPVTALHGERDILSVPNVTGISAG